MNAESQPRPEAAVSTSPSAGAILRQYRQTRGVEPETLAASLHVPVNKIQALEDDRLDAMPDIMFARALAMSVCRYLKVDATPVLARMPQQDASRLAARDERGIDSPLSRPSLMPEGSAQVLQRFLTVRTAAVAVVVLGLVYVGSQSGRAPAPTAAVMDVPASPALATPGATETTTAASDAPTAPASTGPGGAMTPSPIATAPASTPSATPAASSTVTTPLSPPATNK